MVQQCCQCAFVNHKLCNSADPVAKDVLGHGLLMSVRHLHHESRAYVWSLHRSDTHSQARRSNIVDGSNWMFMSVCADHHRCHSLQTQHPSKDPTHRDRQKIHGSDSVAAYTLPTTATTFLYTCVWCTTATSFIYTCVCGVLCKQGQQQENTPGRGMFMVACCPSPVPTSVSLPVPGYEPCWCVLTNRMSGSS